MNMEEMVSVVIIFKPTQKRLDEGKLQESLFFGRVYTSSSEEAEEIKKSMSIYQQEEIESFFLEKGGKKSASLPADASMGDIEKAIQSLI